MKIGAIPPEQLARRLTSTAGLVWRAGPFRVRLRAEAPEFAASFHRLYAAHHLFDPPWNEVNDFHVALTRSRGLRRWWRPKVHFEADGPSPLSPFPLSPFPLDHALPLFEWGLNYCIATRAHQYLILHAAVVARGDRALLLPGLPGAGKSTLCAALMLTGWRLLSDEFALVRPDETGAIHPLPRAISL
ncbi:MAG: HprK-related kinase A, partial [Magnetococcales bacterium]|nr:HprK-related kinase A [Magnetococcales bacterium]